MVMPGSPQFAAHLTNTPDLERMARDRDAAPAYMSHAVPSYEAYRDETRRQFDHLTAPKRRGGVGLDVDVSRTDPYAGPAPMFKDVQENHHLSVLSTHVTGGHPFMSDDDNDMFRAVHDFHGHFESGRGFDRHGEEAAYRTHARMYSPLAHPALATETRAQTAHIALRHSFPDQKVAVIGAERPLRRLVGPERASMMLQAKQFHAQQGLAL